MQIQICECIYLPGFIFGPCWKMSPVAGGYELGRPNLEFAGVRNCALLQVSIITTCVRWRRCLGNLPVTKSDFCLNCDISLLQKRLPWRGKADQNHKVRYIVLSSLYVEVVTSLIHKSTISPTVNKQTRASWCQLESSWVLLLVVVSLSSPRSICMCTYPGGVLVMWRWWVGSAV